MKVVEYFTRIPEYIRFWNSDLKYKSYTKFTKSYKLSLDWYIFGTVTNFVNFCIANIKITENSTNESCVRFHMDSRTSKIFKFWLETQKLWRKYYSAKYISCAKTLSVLQLWQQIRRYKRTRNLIKFYRNEL